MTQPDAAPDPNRGDESPAGGFLDQPGVREKLEELNALRGPNPPGMGPSVTEQLLGGAKLANVMASFQAQMKQVVDALPDDGEPEDPEEAAAADRLADSLAAAAPAKTVGDLANVPGAAEVRAAAETVKKGRRLEVSVEVTSPPVDRVERACYDVAHYTLIFDPLGSKVTFRCKKTPRQDYLPGHEEANREPVGWPAMLALPRRKWPDLTVLWDTLRVCDYSLRQAMRSNDYKKTDRPDLLPHAETALRAGLGTHD